MCSRQVERGETETPPLKYLKIRHLCCFLLFDHFFRVGSQSSSAPGFGTLRVRFRVPRTGCSMGVRSPGLTSNTTSNTPGSGSPQPHHAICNTPGCNRNLRLDAAAATYVAGIVEGGGHGVERVRLRPLRCRHRSDVVTDDRSADPDTDWVASRRSHHRRSRSGCVSRVARIRLVPPASWSPNPTRNIDVTLVSRRMWPCPACGAHTRALRPSGDFVCTGSVVVGQHTIQVGATPGPHSQPVLRQVPVFAQCGTVYAAFSPLLTVL